jgi:hypothetical protein
MRRLGTAEMGEAWTRFGHVSGEARRRAVHDASRVSTAGVWRGCEHGVNTRRGRRERASLGREREVRLPFYRGGEGSEGSAGERNVAGGFKASRCH